MTDKTPPEEDAVAVDGEEANQPPDVPHPVDVPPEAPPEADGDAPAVTEAADVIDPEVTTESVIEALLLTTDGPLSSTKIARILGAGDGNDVNRHVDALNEKYVASGAAFRIQRIAKGYQVLTLPIYDRWVSKLQKTRSETRLSGAARETLAIVAYRQPVLRADIEAIRGVASGDMLIRLRDAGLVRIAGRAEEIGRPLLYGTTARFLDVFGLGAIKDLPKLDQEDMTTIPALKMADET